jgi:phosphoribosylformimino-5-aminoimidazole carboxamide ribonucleotide (ProFAR) isomerase
VPGLLLAAGGVGSAADVDAAVAAGADAVVVGRAMLDGTIAFA